VGNGPGDLAQVVLREHVDVVGLVCEVRAHPGHQASKAGRETRGQGGYVGLRRDGDADVLGGRANDG